MFGDAFKCDQCGRVSFVARTGVVSGPPPFGWFALSGVGEENTAWPVWHFDTAQCLAEFSDGILPEVSAQEYREMTSVPVTDNPGAAEVTISAWEAPVDEQTG
jgi:hypothetical protein